MGLCLIGIKVVRYQTLPCHTVTCHSPALLPLTSHTLLAQVMQHVQVTTPADAMAAKAQLAKAQAPLSAAVKQKLLESDGVRKAANKTIDALRVGAGNVYEAAAALGSFQGKYPVGPRDLLVAFPADEAHVPLVQAGRQWHKVPHQNITHQQAYFAACHPDVSLSAGTAMVRQWSHAWELVRLTAAVNHDVCCMFRLMQASLTH